MFLLVSRSPRPQWQLVCESPTCSFVSVPRVFIFTTLLLGVYYQITQNTSIASSGGVFILQFTTVFTLTLSQYWRNGFFDRTSLHSLGHICHLGHDGDPCPIETPSHNLIIIDMNGWHRVRVRFCTCNANTTWNERYRQLLRMSWYPASCDCPQTAFSFDLLETHHKVSFQGKLNLYDFYLSIMQKSDNQGRSKMMVSDL